MLTRELFFDVVWLYSWFEFISTRELFFDVLVFVSYSLDVAMSVAWLGVIHPPSILTLFASPVAFLRPAAPPFSENIDFITLSIDLDFISSRECFRKMYGFNQLGWISYRRENGLWRCMGLINWFEFHVDERMGYDVVFVFVSYSLDIRYFMAMSVAWLGVIHPPSIFTLFASPVVFLRRSAPPPFSENVDFITLFSSRINTSSIRDIRLYHFYTHLTLHNTT